MRKVGKCQHRYKLTVECMICVQNYFWSLVLDGDHKRFLILISCLKSYRSEKSEIFWFSLFSTALQTLLYTKWFDNRCIQLTNGLQLDFRNLRRIRDTTTFLFWQLRNLGKSCITWQNGLEIKEIVVESNHRRIVQQILEFLLNSPAFKPCLEDGIPLVHLLMIVGHVVYNADPRSDLFKLYLEKEFVLDVHGLVSTALMFL